MKNKSEAIKYFSKTKQTKKQTNKKIGPKCLRKTLPCFKKCGGIYLSGVYYICRSILKKSEKYWTLYFFLVENIDVTQQTVTRLKSTIETVEKSLKYVQS